ncbi:hypothetical protein [Priestia megaterium]|uniref:hypothetical protein n=1 Tax=Priestia megaterium TaxID=1404 RepID=UPI003009CE74
MPIKTNASILIEATEKELRGKRFVAFNIYRNGVAKGTHIHEVVCETDIFLKVVDGLYEIGAQQAEIVTDSQTVLKAFFNVSAFSVVFNRDKDIYRPLHRYFDEGTEYFEVIKELYFMDRRPHEENHKTSSMLVSFFSMCERLLSRLLKINKRETE